MKKFFKNQIQHYLNKRGYEIIKTNLNKQNWLEKFEIKTIIDVGSNEGQFIQYINQLLPNRKIYAFEPIKACYDKLVNNTKRLNVTAFNCGLSDNKTTAEMNISNNFVSSSMLAMDEIHIRNYPESYYKNKENIELNRLDDMLVNQQIQKNILLKIDVQGYEDKVIAGGEKTIEETKVVLIESCFQTLYKGQWLFDDIYKYFLNKNFKFMGFLEQSQGQFQSGTSFNEPLFADSIFIKE